MTRASSGIGYELARCCADNGFDLLIAADEPAIHDAADALRVSGVDVEALEVDLATRAGVDQSAAEARGQSTRYSQTQAVGSATRLSIKISKTFARGRRPMITGTLYLIHKISLSMRERRAGRIYDRLDCVAHAWELRRGLQRFQGVRARSRLRYARSLRIQA